MSYVAINGPLVFSAVKRYDTVYLTCSKKLTDSQLSLPHGINKNVKKIKKYTDERDKSGQVLLSRTFCLFLYHIAKLVRHITSAVVMYSKCVNYLMAIVVLTV